MKNWKTTSAGIIAAASLGIGHAFPEYAVICDVVTVVALTALGVSAKDYNVHSTDAEVNKATVKEITKNESA